MRLLYDVQNEFHRIVLSKCMISQLHGAQLTIDAFAGLLDFFEKYGKEFPSSREVPGLVDSSDLS